MRSFTGQFIRQISTASHPRTDGDLLDGFLTRNLEADFAELVCRYSSMVWGVCRRNLPDHADAEDAFQTVFLVLVRRGKKLIGAPTIGPWLPRVAVWTTRNLRRRNAHRISRQVSLDENLPATPNDRDLSLDLDDALLALPEKFRASIILCHLMGLSRAEAATMLGCPEGTLSAWLSRALAKLRKKLGDLDPTRTLGIVAVAPAGLSVSVVDAAAAFQATGTTAALSSSLHPLVKGVLQMFWVKKATAATVALFAVFALGVGVGVSTHLAPVGGQDSGPLQKTGNAPAPPKGLNVPEDLVDTNTILKRLEVQLEKTDQEYKTKMHVVEHFRRTVLDNTKAVIEKKLDRKVLENNLDALARAQSEAEELAQFRDKVKEAMTKIKELAPAAETKPKPKESSEGTVPKKVETPTPPAASDDLDKKLSELNKLLAEKKKLFEEKRNELMHLEDELYDLKRRVKDLEQRMVKDIEDKISELEKKKPAPPKP
jgi:RNA polymerase sigma factor (sigma-70 family)